MEPASKFPEKWEIINKDKLTRLLRVIKPHTWPRWTIRSKDNNLVSYLSDELVNNVSLKYSKSEQLGTPNLETILGI